MLKTWLFLNEVEKNLANERRRIEEVNKDRMLNVTQKMLDRYQKLDAFRLWQLHSISNIQ